MCCRILCLPPQTILYHRHSLPLSSSISPTRSQITDRQEQVGRLPGFRLWHREPRLFLSHVMQIETSGSRFQGLVLLLSPFSADSSFTFFLSIECLASWLCSSVCSLLLVDSRSTCPGSLVSIPRRRSLPTQGLTRSVRSTSRSLQQTSIHHVKRQRIILRPSPSASSTLASTEKSRQDQCDGYHSLSEPLSAHLHDSWERSRVLQRSLRKSSIARRTQTDRQRVSTSPLLHQHSSTS